MSLRTTGLVAILTVSLTSSALFADEDDPKTPDTTTTPTPTPKPPEEKPIRLTTKYREVGEVVAQVFKADSKSVTIRVTWYTQTTKTPRTNFGHWSQGSNSRNPQQMYAHMMQMQQAMARQAIRAAANTKVQEHHQDYTFPYTEDAHARVKHLPPKLDEKGKQVPYTHDELVEAKANVALHGYERPLDSVKEGAIVELHLGRMVNAPKDKKDDLFIRWIYILDESTVKAQKKPATDKLQSASKN